MSPDDTIIQYLRGVNAAVGRAPDPRALKLRRVLDSLDMVDFLSYLEQTFAIRVSDQDVLARNFETVGSVIEFVRRKAAPR